MTKIFEPTAVQRAKWRAQAERAAEILKSRLVDYAAGKDTVKMGFVFNDATVTVEMLVTDVQRLEGPALADFLFHAVVDKVRESQH